jgi:hypothetical protein
MKRLKNVNKNVSLISKDDIIKDENLKAKIQSLDDKVQQMLLWSTICSVWSYLVLIIVIARIYNSFHGQHPVLLVCSLVLMYIFMGILIWIVWKGMAGNHGSFYTVSKSHLNYQVAKLTGQRKLTSFYLLEYALLMAVSSVFFFMDIKHGLTLLLKITTPVSIITYVLGIYFIIKFTRQMKKLQLMSQQVSDAGLTKNFRQN